MGVTATAGCNFCRIRYKRTVCDSEQGRQNKRLKFLGCRPSWRRLTFKWKPCAQCPHRRRAPPCCSSPLSETLAPRRPAPKPPTDVYGQFYQDLSPQPPQPLPANTPRRESPPRVHSAPQDYEDLPTAPTSPVRRPVSASVQPESFGNFRRQRSLSSSRPSSEAGTERRPRSLRLESQILAEVSAAPELPSAGDQVAQMNAFMMANNAAAAMFSLAGMVGPKPTVVRAPSRMHLGTAEIGMINTGAAMAAGMHPSLVATPAMYAAAAGGIKPIYSGDPRDLAEWVVQFEDYLRSIALGMPTDATTKMALLRGCLDRSWEKELMLRHERHRLGQGPAVTYESFYGDLKRSGAVEDKARARQEWYELRLRTSGRVSEAQWRTLTTDFKMLRLRVGNATEDEATRLAKKLVPQAFVDAFVEHDEKELPKIKLTGVDQYTATEIGDFFRSLQIPLKEVRPDCKGYMLAELERKEQVDEALKYNGGRLADGSLLGVERLAMDSDAVFEWVLRKIITKQKAAELSGKAQQNAPVEKETKSWTPKETREPERHSREPEQRNRSWYDRSRSRSWSGNRVRGVEDSSRHSEERGRKGGNGKNQRGGKSQKGKGGRQTEQSLPQEKQQKAPPAPAPPVPPSMGLPPWNPTPPSEPPPLQRSAEEGLRRESDNTREEYIQRCKETGACFNCGQKGHYSGECPRRVPRRADSAGPSGRGSSAWWYETRGDSRRREGEGEPKGGNKGGGQGGRS